jgi:hypothetical protein
MDKREEANRCVFLLYVVHMYLILAISARERFAIANSDLLTDVNAYEECRKMSSEKGGRSLRAFCEEVIILVTTVMLFFNLSGLISSSRTELYFSIHYP